jgi:hypothetical protein
MPRVCIFLYRHAAKIRRAAAHALSGVMRPGGARDDAWICLECTDAAGQDFCDLEAYGYKVYRDFHGKGFVIGHIAVGPRGVFAAGEERQAAPGTGKGVSGGGRVFFDNPFFRSPVWVEAASLAGVRRQAAWLSRWLESRVGEAVTVYPLLVIAGWLSNRRKWGDIFLVSRRDYEALTERDGKGLSKSVIEEIHRHLDGRCDYRAPARALPGVP